MSKPVNVKQSVLDMSAKLQAHMSYADGAVVLDDEAAKAILDEVAPAAMVKQVLGARDTYIAGIADAFVNVAKEHVTEENPDVSLTTGFGRDVFTVSLNHEKGLQAAYTNKGASTTSGELGSVFKKFRSTLAEE